MVAGIVGSVDWAIEMLEDAETVEEIELVLRGSVRAAVAAQGATVVRRTGAYCYYADEDAMSPLWKGQQFPIARCVSGWAMLHHQTVVIPDIRRDSRIPQDAYRPTFVRSLVMVPVGVASPVGAIGAYWAHEHSASPEEVAILERLAGAAAAALSRVRGGQPLVAASPGNASLQQSA